MLYVTIENKFLSNIWTFGLFSTKEHKRISMPLKPMRTLLFKYRLSLGPLTEETNIYIIGKESRKKTCTEYVFDLQSKEVGMLKLCWFMCLLTLCKWISQECLGRCYWTDESCCSALAGIRGTHVAQLLSSALAELQKPLPRLWEGNYISSWGKNSNWHQWYRCIFLCLRDTV